MELPSKVDPGTELDLILVVEYDESPPFTVQWRVLEDGGAQLIPVATWGAPPASEAALSIVLPAGTLAPNMSYYFEADVHFENGHMASMSLARPTLISAVVARIAGGAVRSVAASQPLLMDARLSFDPNKAPFAVKTWQWACMHDAAADACDFLTPLNAASPNFIAPASMLRAGRYVFNLTYSVTTNDPLIVRSSRASAVVFVFADPLPAVSLRLVNGQTTGSLPFGSSAIIVASAQPHPDSPSLPSSLLYSWSVNSAQISQPMREFVASTVSPTLEVPFSSGWLTAGASYSFKVTVSDPGAGGSSAAAETEILVLAPPQVSLSVFPGSGAALSTVFTLNASIVPGAIQPVQYEFGYVGLDGRDAVIRGHSFDSEVHTTLLSGNPVDLYVVATDAQGSRARATAACSVIVPAAPPSSTGLCGEVERFSTDVQNLLATIPSFNGSDLDLCAAVEAGTQADIRTGRYSATVSAVSQIQASADAFLARVENGGYSVRASVAQCSGLQGGASSCADSGGAVTAESLTGTIFDTLLSKLAIVTATPGAARVTARASVQSLGAVLSSQAANLSSVAIVTAANATRAAIERLGVDELVSGGAAQDAVSAVSALVGLARNASSASLGARARGATRSADPCAAVDGAVDLVDSLLARTGAALAPGTTPLQLDSDNIAASVRVVFSDTASTGLNFSNVAGALSGTGGATVELPVSASALSGGLELQRPSAVVALAKWSGASTSCREGVSTTAELTLLSAVHSVTVSQIVQSGGAAAAQNPTTVFPDGGTMKLRVPAARGGDAGAVCVWWNAMADEWSPSGCVFQGMENGAATCECSHLTEFALIRREREQGGADVPRSVQMMFVIFLMAYAMVGGYVAVQLARLAHARGWCSVSSATVAKVVPKSKQKSVFVVHVLIAGHCALRAASCSMYGRVGPGLLSGRAALFLLSALPAMVSFSVVSFILFQWMALLNNSSLSSDPFKRFRALYGVLCVVVCVVALITFGLAALGPGGAAITEAGSIIFAAVAVAVAAGMLHNARGFHRTLSSVSRSAILIRLRLAATAITACYALSSGAWAAAAFVRGDDALYGFTAMYLLADIAIWCTFLSLYAPALRKAVGSSAAVRRSGAQFRVESSGTRLSTTNSSTSPRVRLDDDAHYSAYAFKDSMTSSRRSGLSSLKRGKKHSRGNPLNGSREIYDVRQFRNSKMRELKAMQDRMSDVQAVDVEMVSVLDRDMARLSSGRVADIDALLSPSGGPGRSFFSGSTLKVSRNAGLVSFSDIKASRLVSVEVGDSLQSISQRAGEAVSECSVVADSDASLLSRSDRKERAPRGSTSSSKERFVV